MFDWKSAAATGASLLDVEGVPVVGSVDGGFRSAITGAPMSLGRVMESGAPASREEFEALFPPAA